MDQSVVEWCEAHTDAYTYSTNIAELTNTFSNLAFTLVSLLSIYEFNNPLFRTCNIVLFLVGIGSATFHATDTYLGQILDEAPMSMLMYYYLFIACHIQKWRFPRVMYIGLATFGWSLYLTFRIYTIFITMFVVQLVFPILIVVFYVKKTKTQKRLLLYSLVMALIAKSCWIYERYLHATFQCPTMFVDPSYYLHSYWHIGIAIAHYLFMKTLFACSNDKPFYSNQI